MMQQGSIFTSMCPEGRAPHRTLSCAPQPRAAKSAHPRLEQESTHGEVAGCCTGSTWGMA